MNNAPARSPHNLSRLSLQTYHLRIILPLLIVLIYWLDSGARTIITQALADAYIAVGVFVAITLFAYYLAEKKLGFDIAALENKPPVVQISIVALLGALPGCGGAIIVVSQYASGRLGFAALVTVLVSTMGDAAFLLLAKSPQTGLIVISTGIVVGILSGLVIHVLHAPDFLKKDKPRHDTMTTANSCTPQLPRGVGFAWTALLCVALPLTILSSFQLESPVVFRVNSTIAIGTLGAMLCLTLWAIQPLQPTYRSIVAEDSVALPPHETTAAPAPSIIARVVHDTNFIMVWVIVAFLLFELLVHYTGLDIGILFNAAAWLAPLIGVIVGFLPGCGPQIIIASLYLQGIAPLSTLLGNAISNDGDALFPAIALAPKAALLATIYSAVPALIVAYTVFFFSA